ncbi:inositol monophosphatase family protein [Paenibacillus sp. P25]|nr:inositol monophosphatase family protein [Paenibacillus sp. P25]
MDGAVQFLQGVSSFSIALCLIRGGEPVASFIYDPVQKEFFHALKGEGAFLNGVRIRPSAKTDLSVCVLATTPPVASYQEISSADQSVAGYSRRSLPHAFAVRALGSVSLQLAYVACGRLDGYFEYGDDLYDWIAGSLILTESGVRVTGIDGSSPFTYGTSGILAANSELHQQPHTLLSA